MYLKFNANMISSSLFLILPFISKLTSDILLWIAGNFSNSIFSSKSHPPLKAYHILNQFLSFSKDVLI